MCTYEYKHSFCTYTYTYIYTSLYRLYLRLSISVSIHIEMQQNFGSTSRLISYKEAGWQNLIFIVHLVSNYTLHF